MTPEPEEEANANRILMDMDLDLGDSWQFDQIDESPFFLSISEHQQQQQPFSPLWAFADDGFGNHGGFVGGAGVFRLADCSRMLSYAEAHDQNVEDDNGLNPDESKKQLPSQALTALIPKDNREGYYLIKERMTQALRHFKELTEQHVLAQVWAPIKHNGRQMLTTSGQPFVLDPNSNGLPQYRLVSQIYMFSIDGDSSDGNLGLPGRVFRQKLPEWTPNVQYYSTEEFPRLNHALHYNVRGTLALPVFEPSGQSCVGVIELIMTSQKINYAPEVDKVCKALEAVNLKSSEILDHQSTQICNQARQNALAEILEIITVVCETHALPLAQTWVPCMHGTVLANGGGLAKTCSSFDGSCRDRVCMSTTDVAFYIVDAHMWGFRDACAEHHLQKGQGVCGHAFASRGASFCQDITEFCKTEYPLVHYARMFGLRGSFAVCLRSEFTGEDEYVLEFFLPVDAVGFEEQRKLLDSIFGTVREHIGSLRVASGRGLDEVLRSIEIVRASLGEEKQSFGAALLPPRNDSNGESIANNVKGNAVIKKDPCKKGERRRGKAEKTISLEVLQQYYAGSLKDAAKSLGVCPTTMKRICRQHGISRWPSRTINKVNRSISKLKRVMESVHGGEETFTLTNPIPSAVASIPRAAPNSNGPSKARKQDKKAQAREQAEKINSGEESTETHTSHGSCQGSPRTDQLVSPIVVAQQTGEITKSSIQNGFERLEQKKELEHVGSSHDLRNLCRQEEHVITEHSCIKGKGRSFWDKSRVRDDNNVITVKAAYGGDIIRFRLGMDLGVEKKLREEVAKRFRLDIEAFDVKYLDDDHEWVLIACDADLLECVELSRSSSPSGNGVVRLVVTDVGAISGESSGNEL